MSIKKVFIKRLIQEWRFQWDVIHTVLDGVVFIYLVVPALFFAGLFYRDAWQDISSIWPDYYPFVGLVFIMLLLSSSGNFRSYLLEADLLYFVQKKKALYHLKIYGFILSLIKVLLHVILLLMIALPVLVLVYNFSHKEIGSLFLIISGYKLVIMTINKAFKKIRYKIPLSTLVFIAAILSITTLSAEVYGFIGFLLIIITIIFHLQFAKNNHHFYRELEIENTEHHKYIGLLMGFSAMLGSSLEIEKAATYNRRKPLLLFRGSKRIFKVRNEENGLLEFCLKAFLRNKTYRSSYFKLVGVTSLALAFLPPWLKVVIYLLFIFFSRSWMKGIYSKIIEHPFFQVVKIDEGNIFATQHRFRNCYTITV